jgi:serine/threonine protein kinase
MSSLWMLCAAVRVLAQLGSALAHLHGHGVTHRDLKPGNIVFEDAQKRTVRLVDFGFAGASPHLTSSHPT